MVGLFDHWVQISKAMSVNVSTCNNLFSINR